MRLKQTLMHKTTSVIGLKKGEVNLIPHQKAWVEEAQSMIRALHLLFGEDALDIQHIGSTAVSTIKAKPIIDLAMKVKNFEPIKAKIEALENLGFIYYPHVDLPNAMYFNRRVNNGSVSTHHLHVFHEASQEWKNHLYFRDALREDKALALAYDTLKDKLQNKYRFDRPNYTEKKAEFIQYVIRKFQVKRFLGKTVTMKVDRPIGAIHPKHDKLIYPINYGYIKGEIAPDGEELDVYLLGVDEVVTSYTGKIIAIIHRENDAEDKLVMAPSDQKFTAKAIKDRTHFQEQYYTSTIQLFDK